MATQRKDLMKLATILESENYDVISQLVKMRIDKGLSQFEIAERMGVTQQAVSKFERMDSNPSLSTISRYAMSVGAVVRHSVSDFGNR